VSQPLPVTFVRGAVRPEDLPRAPLPEIAASGRSNVGKSSLLNVVFGRKGMAKVSRTPGKTREINFFDIGGRYHLVDLPGYGYARAPVAAKRKWSDFVRSYLETRGQLAGVLQLVDARHGPTALDREMLGWLRGRALPVAIVATKMDKLKRAEAERSVRDLEREAAGWPVIPFSAVTRDGRRPVLAWIDGVLEAWSGLPRA
jgi:GTP-binding protein